LEEASNKRWLIRNQNYNGYGQHFCFNLYLL
jgi:hypothetical protein